MMPPRSLFVVLLLTFAGNAVADFAQRTQAMDLQKEGKHQEALAIFLKMGETRKDLAQAEALLGAVNCSLAMGNPERALELARSIRLKPYGEFARLTILRNQKNWKEISAFPEEEIAGWPEKLIPLAHLIIAGAYEAEGRFSEAAEEYAAAAKATISTPEKARSLLMQAQAAEKAGLGDQELLALYGQIVALSPKGGGILQRARIARVKLLVRQGNESLALEELQALEAAIKTKDPYWSASIQIAYGSIHAAFNRPEEARASYQRATEVANIPPDLLKEAKAGLNGGSSSAR